MLLISCSAYSFHAFSFHSISITQPEDTRELLINVKENVSELIVDWKEKLAKETRKLKVKFLI